MSKMEELKPAFEKLVAENTDKNGKPVWAAVVKGLTELGLTTLKDKPWTRPNAERFWSRLQQRLARNRDEIPTARENETREAVGEARGADGRAELGTDRERETREDVGTPSVLGKRGVDFFDTPWGENVTKADYDAFIRELWEAHKAGVFAEALTRGEIGTHSDTALAEMPDIVVPKQGTSINVNYELRELLKAKVQKDPEYPHRQGYTWTKIFVWLAWRYMGCPNETFPKGKEPQADERTGEKEP